MGKKIIIYLYDDSELDSLIKEIKRAINVNVCVACGDETVIVA
jgi:hypothetical protein